MSGLQSKETAANSTEATLGIQRLISTIEVSFSRLRDENKEQSHGFTVALERLTAAVEKLNTQPQPSDKRTAFWTVYGKLADEFDKEFLQKYGNDLDASLIFAGLFSAVSSAFIIQIQPEFQIDPNSTTEALLLLLVQNVTGTVPAIHPSTQLAPPVAIVVAQSLLYFSLLSTLLAALLAVLGKQWLLHYDSLGERGTIEERGLERQRKLDGLRRWHFDLVMQIFPLLLQFALLLFAAALSVYLWTIHIVLASIVLGFTSLGAVFYGLMVASALVSLDSPFQTPLTTILRVVIKLLQKKFAAMTLPQFRLLSIPHSAISSLTTRMRSLLPEYAIEVFRMKTIRRLFAANFRRSLRPRPVATPSPETSALTWVLEVSTDPRVVEVAAAFVPELQWPFQLDLRQCLRRLSDAFNGCFQGPQLREGMGDRASNCMKAFGLLEMVTIRAEGWSKLWTFPYHDISNTSRDLRSMIHYFRFPSRTLISSEPITHWALRFIAARQTSNVNLDTLLQNFNPEEYSNNLVVFADFLFSVSTFFIRTKPQGLSLLNKSESAPTPT
ncbi:hypothetical protein C8F04DRAFT_276461 [Mycena alexandri]|uniref:DUF6535 domain-containing protein n=1 Tax=Mycena alexandri TaxID=1745969 RepID=A0AAD6S678_9AGAR|nr:hypothetical protein C8F04DRAFT_276461 [Mycena alexandri]